MRYVLMIMMMALCVNGWAQGEKKELKTITLFDEEYFIVTPNLSNDPDDYLLGTVCSKDSSFIVEYYSAFKHIPMQYNYADILDLIRDPETQQPFDHLVGEVDSLYGGCAQRWPYIGAVNVSDRGTLEYRCIHVNNFYFGSAVYLAFEESKKLCNGKAFASYDAETDRYTVVYTFEGTRPEDYRVMSSWSVTKGISSKVRYDFPGDARYIPDENILPGSDPMPLVRCCWDYENPKYYTCPATKLVPYTSIII